MFRSSLWTVGLILSLSLAPACKRPPEKFDVTVVSKIPKKLEMLDISASAKVIKDGIVIDTKPMEAKSELKAEFELERGFMSLK